MKPNLAQGAAKSAKILAQSIAKQVRDESVEVLKTAASQVTGAEKTAAGESSKAGSPEEQLKLIEHQNELQDKMKSSRLMQAFQAELDDIRRQDVFKDLQTRIAGGEVIPLEDFQDLSLEQREVLKAQIDAVTLQKEQQEVAQKSNVLSMPISKRGRQMGGQKREAEKQQTRVEKPVPPSG